jgi:short-subunit dehydrogenase
MRSIDGKSALITGAASGIGRALALALARERANLFLVDFDQAGLAAVAEEARELHPNVIAHVADLTRREDVQGIVDRLLWRWDGVDILINNAGIAYYGATHKMTAEQWDRLVAVNLLAPIELTCKLLPAMLRRSEAHILNVCSVAGLVAAPKLAAYHATKFGLLGFTESLRAEYGPRGLGVTAFCPGFVRTNIYRATMTAGQKSVPRIPSWLAASPERIARRAVRAIRRSEGVVVVTPLAHFVWRFKRFAPGLFDWLQHFRRYRRSGGSIVPASKAVTLPFTPQTDTVQDANDSHERFEHIIPFPLPEQQHRLDQQHRRAA